MVVKATKVKANAISHTGYRQSPTLLLCWQNDWSIMFFEGAKGAKNVAIVILNL